MVSFAVYLNSDLHIGTPNFPNLIRNFPHPNGSNAQQVVFASGLLARPAQPRSKKNTWVYNCGGIPCATLMMWRVFSMMRCCMHDSWRYPRCVKGMKMKKEIPRSLRAKAPENWWFEDVCNSFWGLVNFQGRAEKKHWRDTEINVFQVGLQKLCEVN